MPVGGRGGGGGGTFALGFGGGGGLGAGLFALAGGRSGGGGAAFGLGPGSDGVGSVGGLMLLTSDVTVDGSDGVRDGTALPTSGGTIAGRGAENTIRLGDGGRGGLVFLTSDAVVAGDGGRCGFELWTLAGVGSRGGHSSGGAAGGRAAEDTNLPGGRGNPRLGGGGGFWSIFSRSNLVENELRSSKIGEDELMKPSGSRGSS